MLPNPLWGMCFHLFLLIDLWGLRAQNMPNRVADNGGEAGPITFDLLIQPLGIAKEIHLPIF